MNVGHNMWITSAEMPKLHVFYQQTFCSFTKNYVPPILSIYMYTYMLLIVLRVIIF